MPDKVTFPKQPPRWLFDRDCVQFFAILNGRDVFKCVVSAEALEQHFGANDLSEEEGLKAFEKHRDKITAVAAKKILEGGLRGGKEVSLKIADFVRTATTTTPPPDPNPKILIVNEPNFDEPLRLALRHVNEQLEMLAGKRPGLSATWSLLDADGEGFASLIVADSRTDTSVQGLYSRDEVFNHDFMTFSIYRLWDDFIRSRMNAQLAALEHASDSQGVTE